VAAPERGQTGQLIETIALPIACVTTLTDAPRSGPIGHLPESTPEETMAERKNDRRDLRNAIGKTGQATMGVGPDGIATPCAAPVHPCPLSRLSLFCRNHRRVLECDDRHCVERRIGVGFDMAKTSPYTKG